jgi:CARDB protein/PASTA domain-containing protein
MIRPRQGYSRWWQHSARAACSAFVLSSILLNRVGAAQTAISFDDVPQGELSNQLALRGVRFNSVEVVDYGARSFARSGSKGIEQCRGEELCNRPFRFSFDPAVSQVRVWVGYSNFLPQAASIEMRLLDARNVVVGVSRVALPAGTPRVPVQASLGLAAKTPIAAAEVGFADGRGMGGLIIDDLEFEPMRVGSVDWLIGGAIMEPRGDAALFTAEVTNLGSSEAPATEVLITSPERGWVAVAVPVQGLRPSETAVARARIPIQLSPGLHRFEAMVDWRGTVAEMNEGNNRTGGEFRVGGPELPDLVLHRVRAELDGARAVRLSVEVRNGGSAPSTATAIEARSAGWEAVRVSLGQLQPGERSRIILIGAGSFEPGLRTFRVTVDPDQRVVEATRANNAAEVQVMFPQALVTVPGIVGRTQRQASYRLTRRRLRIGQVLRHSEGITRDVIERQKPDSGTKVPTRTGVDIVLVSEARVPDLADQTIEHARSVLARNGLALGAISRPVAFGTWNSSIRSQDPSAGTFVAIGSTVGVEAPNAALTRWMSGVLAVIGGGLVGRFLVRPHWTLEGDSGTQTLEQVEKAEAQPLVSFRLIVDPGTQIIVPDR